MFKRKLLFLGAGEHSMARCYELHKKLEECINHLGGLQQPDHPDHELNEEEIFAFKADTSESKYIIKENLKDILVAFGYAPILKEDDGERKE